MGNSQWGSKFGLPFSLLGYFSKKSWNLLNVKSIKISIIFLIESNFRKCAVESHNCKFYYQFPLFHFYFTSLKHTCMLTYCNLHYHKAYSCSFYSLVLYREEIKKKIKHKKMKNFSLILFILLHTQVHT